MVTPSNQSPDRELSPEAKQLQDAINRAFAQVGEAFRKLAEPRWTWDEIQIALENASDKQCGYDFDRADLLKDVREELTRVRNRAT